jgi:hypothetical protein
MKRLGCKSPKEPLGTHEHGRLIQKVGRKEVRGSNLIRSGLFPTGPVVDLYEFSVLHLVRLK